MRADQRDSHDLVLSKGQVLGGVCQCVSLSLYAIDLSLSLSSSHHAHNPGFAKTACSRSPCIIVLLLGLRCSLKLVSDHHLPCSSRKGEVDECLLGATTPWNSGCELSCVGGNPAIIIEILPKIEAQYSLLQ